MYSAQIVKDRIDMRRNEKNISNLEKMLKELDIGKSTIYAMTDKKGIGCFALAKIADHLDCSVDYLLGRTDNPNITADTYGRRYTRAIGFTRDELICIALCLGFSYMELNRLIELHNKAFKKTYRFINHEDSRDALFLKLISTGKKYEYQRINSELRRNKEDEISLLNL